MEKADSQMLVILGASGDLTTRKLIPALYELYIRNLLPENFVVLGVARTALTDDEFRQKQRDGILASQKELSAKDIRLNLFLECLFYVNFDTRDTAVYGVLKDRVNELQKRYLLPDNIIFYMATPPEMYEVIPVGLQKSGLTYSATGFRRIVVEKPFGTNLKSAQHLTRLLESIFDEHDIFRIDHYLGKETVQNILVLRFSNGIFEPLWNRNYVDYVEIISTETLGVENRGNYYETAGALRDMIQNHLLQLMAFIAMEPPATFDPESIRDEIAKVFRSLHHYTPEELQKQIVRGQYIAGNIEGEKVQSYRDEKNVDVKSVRETYVAMKLELDNWRWGGTPFYIYTGKRLAEKKTEIIIHFKSTPQQLFVGQCSGSSCNQLVIRVQPDESIALRFGLKVPGSGFEVRQVSMDFLYSSLSDKKLPDAYERLLLDVMLGDSTLYSRADAQEASWRFIDPIIDDWTKKGNEGLTFYPAGSEGPRNIGQLISLDEKPNFVRCKAIVK
ncbi:glucose-6-phosphate dehydrogenase [Coprobacter sp.]